MHVPHITFRISRKDTFAQITQNIDTTIQSHFAHIQGDDISERDIGAAKEYLKHWVLYATQYDVTQDIHSWNEYFLEARFPRFALKACLNIRDA